MVTQRIGEIELDSRNYKNKLVFLNQEILSN